MPTISHIFASASLAFVALAVSAAEPCKPPADCSMTAAEAAVHTIEIPANPGQVRQGMDTILARVKCVMPTTPPPAIAATGAGSPLGTSSAFLPGKGCATLQRYGQGTGWFDYGDCGIPRQAPCAAAAEP